MMRAAVLFALVGCNQVLGIHGTHRPKQVCDVGNDDDGDGLCDDVDPCPADFGDTTDTDGDGVGDACDPSPTLVGDSIAQFYPMLSIDSDWSVSDGSTWVFENSAIVATNVGNAATEHPAPQPIIEPTVEVEIEPTFGGDGAMVGAYVVAQPSGFILMCRVVHHDSGGDELQILWGGNMSSLNLAATAGGLMESGPLRVYGGQLPDPDHTVRCRARYDTVGVFVDLDKTLSRALGRASFATMGLQTVNASAAFDSVTVYTRQP
jgi:hypothetical protein